MNSTKNTTRLSSILGTWTATSHLKADIGSYEMLAYFTIHFMADPMRGYGCSLKDCHESTNHVCVTNKNTDHVPTCVDMAADDSLIDWSDVTAFIYFGLKVDAGFPFDVHKHMETGDWVGPFSIVMAQEDSKNKTNGTKHGVGTLQLLDTVDEYKTRYVKSPSTSYLQRPEQDTLVGRGEFDRYMGPTAVAHTVQVQQNWTQSRNPDGTIIDPYAPYLETCDNGDVKPILPLYQFKFVQDSITKEERVEVELNYKLLAIPHKNDLLYKFFPAIQNRVNGHHGEFHISGPYCYGADPHRGYTLDFNFDSKVPDKYIKLHHGCVEGLPCLPRAAELNEMAAQYGHEIHDLIPDDPTSVGGGITTICLLGLFLMVSLVVNYRGMRRRDTLVQALDQLRITQEQQQQRPHLEMELEHHPLDDSCDDEEPNSAPNHATTSELSTPLLSQDETSETHQGSAIV
mmetsp:Transcript_22100/g.39831  ORF Transcript_22100/g.39831 Transcript_22100/m.39831 type:complete len:457 (-) Transcript_22100:283-1653(-)|eukprot:CAMPEP_0198284328 /NCGR_PEP_ID=MMETSP1449-20131203/3805_1 /TAXON_ID=420275 /ORGANISM="Attheya septentrionalis, Strain CCMP2084" /LENGTH=456 /DNA_ID=CAMNT_0043981343 /DNA_START=187 /DNA_END=1557 /DNA_ORIENTATION=-